MNKTRLLLFLLIIPFFVNSPALAEEVVAPIQPDKQIQIKTREVDRRAVILQAYLAKHNSPIQYHAQDFVEAADKYDLDWKLVPAIAGVESTFGKHIPGGYNAWGWGVYGTNRIYFRSWTDGIHTVSEGLRKDYLNRGLTDPYSMNKRYAASPTWGSKVSFFLADIEKFRVAYETNNPDDIVSELTPKTAGSSAEIVYAIPTPIPVSR